jgi:single-strand DNA-binding protein
MASVNSVFLIGRLGKATELKTTQAGKAVCTFSIATDSGFGDSKETTWHDIVAWEKTAENCAKFLTKGSSVCVEGRIKKETYEKKDGTGKATSVKIVANRVTFLDTKAKGEREPGSDDDEPAVVSKARTMFAGAQTTEEDPF